MTASRESIYAALFSLVAASASFKTASRRLKLWTDVNAADKPAIFLFQTGENYKQGNEATPQKVTLKADIYIYTNAGKDPNVIPATSINNLVDAVNAAIAESPVTGRQTLGGIVAHCWIEGDIVIDAGDMDGDGVAKIPVRILIP